MRVYRKRNVGYETKQVDMIRYIERKRSSNSWEMRVVVGERIQICKGKLSNVSSYIRLGFCFLRAREHF